MQHNIYFEGNVQSLGFCLGDNYVSIGVIEPGNYIFSTNFNEKVIVLEGTALVKINGQLSEVDEGGWYEVEKGKEFEVHCERPVAYICYYK